MENKSIDWDNSSNASIKMHLQELQNEVNAIKNNNFLDFKRNFLETRKTND